MKLLGYALISYGLAAMVWRVGRAWMKRRKAS